MNETVEFLRNYTPYVDTLLRWREQVHGLNVDDKQNVINRIDQTIQTMYDAITYYNSEEISHYEQVVTNFVFAKYAYIQMLYVETNIIFHRYELEDLSLSYYIATFGGINLPENVVDFVPSLRSDDILFALDDLISNISVVSDGKFSFMTDVIQMIQVELNKLQICTIANPDTYIAATRGVPVELIRNEVFGDLMPLLDILPDDKFTAIRNAIDGSCIEREEDQ